MSKTDDLFYSSLVIEHIVPNGKSFVFRRWNAKFIELAKQHPGFIRADRCPPLPCADGVVKWYTIVHFDTPAHLNTWIASGDREQMLKTGQAIFTSYRFKSLTTGLEGWFARNAGAEHVGSGPPAWKQILSVVLALYPVVMLQSAVFAALGIMQSWTMASSMVVNNLITSTLLTLVVMPQVSRLLNFWLAPIQRPASFKIELLGAGIVAIALGAMVWLFQPL
ncbi:MAG: hypothetical protein HC881_07690 [Leptolyngbyaceae cyanobacterium SL_7_1]|nr:hypothetical protein [Leptolyngbyaceae cyanobacterium SL_7_1]